MKKVFIYYTSKLKMGQKSKKNLRMKMPLKVKTSKINVTSKLIMTMKMTLKMDLPQKCKLCFMVFFLELMFLPKNLGNKTMTVA